MALGGSDDNFVQTTYSDRQWFAPFVDAANGNAVFQTSGSLDMFATQDALIARTAGYVLFNDRNDESSPIADPMTIKFPSGVSIEYLNMVVSQCNYCTHASSSPKANHLAKAIRSRSFFILFSPMMN